MAVFKKSNIEKEMEVMGMGFTSYGFIFVFMPALVIGWKMFRKFECMNHRYSNLFLLIMSIIYVCGGGKTTG